MTGARRPAVTVRAVAPADAERWLELRRALWPEEEGLAEDIERFWAGTARLLDAVLVAQADDDGEILGFAELSIRPYAEGCTTDRVAFLEGWYVVPGARRTGVGGRLIAAGEAWARSRGCTEIGSDALLENALGEVAHKALGFAEVERLRCFIKPLDDREDP